MRRDTGCQSTDQHHRANHCAKCAGLCRSLFGDTGPSLFRALLALCAIRLTIRLVSILFRATFDKQQAYDDQCDGYHCTAKYKRVFVTDIARRNNLGQNRRPDCGSDTRAAKRNGHGNRALVLKPCSNQNGNRQLCQSGKKDIAEAKDNIKLPNCRTNACQSKQCAACRNAKQHKQLKVFSLIQSGNRHRAAGTGKCRNQIDHRPRRGAG